MADPPPGAIDRDYPRRLSATFWADRRNYAGAGLASARHLRLGRPLHLGDNYWYVIPGAHSNAVLKVRRGVTREIGIADKQLTRTRAAQRDLLSRF